MVGYALSCGTCDRVDVVPVVHHRFSKQLSSFAERVHWCRLAFAIYGDRVRVALDEADNPSGATYDMVLRRQQQNPLEVHRLLLGSDLLSGTERWLNFQALCALAPPLIIGRAGHPVPRAWSDQHPGTQVLPAEVPDISSSWIRKQLIAHADVQGWVPAAVLAAMQGRAS